MHITLRIKRYISKGNNIGFPQNDMHVWLTSTALSQLGILTAIEKRPQYVKIECTAPINRFAIYAEVAALNPQLENEEGYIWIPSELVHQRIIFDRNTEVEISPINIEELSVAESVTIRLKEDEVDSWSEDEVSNAKSKVVKNGIAFMQQCVFVKPRTKDVVIGEIESIFPRPESFTQLFVINRNTKVFFEGLPQNLGKTIDFDKIGGLDKVIDKLREIIQLPITCSDHLSRFDIDTPKGMLMYGPPGNGKTMIAKAIAQSMGAAFIAIEGPELMSKYVGVGEQRLREKFEEARTKGNSIIFIDEIDSIASIRSESAAEYQVSIVATLLNLMDGMKSDKVFVIGATNRLSAIDPALRRPGRFDLEFEIPQPSTSARLDILTKYIKLKKEDLFDSSVSSKTLQKLADLTIGYSGADLKMLYREAAMLAVRRNVKIEHPSGKLVEISGPESSRISEYDFFEAMRHIVPTSMRDIEAVANSVPWDDLIAVDNTKSELEQLHNKLTKFVDSDVIQARPSFANVVISGIRGTGKKTIVHSFASHFGYEYFNIDFIRLQSMSIEDAYGEIEKKFSKAKQIAPAVITITNVSNDDQKQFWAKIYNEILLVNKRTKLFVILVLDEEKGVEKYLGYKRFGAHINLPLPTENLVKVVTEKLGVSESGIDEYANKPMGQIISEVREKIILNS